MPLIKSSSKPAFKKNVEVLMGEVGKSPHVKNRAQGLAIAYDTKRRNRADGGQVHEGPIVSEVPGRTDHHGISVAAGSYVAPAEFISHLGENNTLAGLAHLKKIGAHGIRKMARSAQGASAIIAKHRSRGGKVNQPTGHPIPINAAGGEHVWTPEEVKIVGDGDVILGHALLDNLIVQNRKKHVHTLRHLAPPAKD